MGPLQKYLLYPKPVIYYKKANHLGDFMPKKKPQLLIREAYEKKQKEMEKKGKTFTWEEFATAMGMENPSSTRSNVSKILGDEYNPTFKKLCNIAEALGVKVSSLIRD